MTRPKPTISSPNEYETYFRQAQVFGERFAGFEGVVGVLLTGGVARGYADHFSELDLAVYLTRFHFEDWTRRGLASFPEGDSCVEGWHVDFDYLCYEDEMAGEWEHVKRWDQLLRRHPARPAGADAGDAGPQGRPQRGLLPDAFCSNRL